MLRADAVVDFSTLGSEFGQHPAVDLDEDPDRLRSPLGTTDGLQVSSPQVVFGDISLDLGSFISNFAGPILQTDQGDPRSARVADRPDGFLNMRIPLLSDLAGHTITGADLVEFFDPTDGPTIKSFLSFVQSSTTSSISSSRRRARVTSSSTSATSCSRPARPQPATRWRRTARAFRRLDWAFFDAPLNVGFGRHNLADMPDLSNLSIPDELADAVDGRRRRALRRPTSRAGSTRRHGVRLPAARARRPT